MSHTISLDFQQILLHPALAYEEGLRFFRGVGLMNNTLRQFAKDLDTRNIVYSVIGAVALNQHGYHRFTEDIDVLMTTEGLQKFREELVGRGYRPAFEGAPRKFRTTAEDISMKVILTGEYPGDKKPRSVVFPDPAENNVDIDGIKTITLTKLVELKLASGMTGAGRRKDLADVQELIRVCGLAASFAEQLDSSVQTTYLELHGEIVQAQNQMSAPDRDFG